jgi:biopolymer transport protein ExbD
MKPMASMNVIPFIDIMLVLLAVVLTTATFVAQGRIPISLPAAASAHPVSTAEKIEISVSRSGDLLVDDVPVDITALGERVGHVDNRTPVVLRVDEDAAFAHFVAVVDLLKVHGFANLSILTRRVAP